VESSEPMNNNKRNKPDHDSSPETEQKLFRGGTQVGRTQLKQEKTEDQNMEEIKQILLELSREVKEMSNDISQNNKEMKSLRENVRIMQVNWEKEKLDLEEKITKTEEKIEKLKKDKIRNNLIVTGIRAVARMFTEGGHTSWTGGIVIF
jgi:predicted RNase H-like nuclease (RuvC/YqgF family)